MVLPKQKAWHFIRMRGCVKWMIKNNNAHYSSYNLSSSSAYGPQCQQLTYSIYYSWLRTIEIRATTLMYEFTNLKEANAITHNSSRQTYLVCARAQVVCCLQCQRVSALVLFCARINSSTLISRRLTISWLDKVRLNLMMVDGEMFLKLMSSIWVTCNAQTRFSHTLWSLC